MGNLGTRGTGSTPSRWWLLAALLGGWVLQGILGAAVAALPGEAWEAPWLVLSPGRPEMPLAALFLAGLPPLLASAAFLRRPSRRGLLWGAVALLAVWSAVPWGGSPAPGMMVDGFARSVWLPSLAIQWLAAALAWRSPGPAAAAVPVAEQEEG